VEWVRLRHPGPSHRQPIPFVLPCPTALNPPGSGPSCGVASQSRNTSASDRPGCSARTAQFAATECMFHTTTLILIARARGIVASAAVASLCASRFFDEGTRITSDVAELADERSRLDEQIQVPALHP
jgi:hypothetical protein